MTVTEAATILGYRSTRAVRSLIASGKLSATRQKDGSYQINKSTLERFQRSYKPDPRGRKRGAPVKDVLGKDFATDGVGLGGRGFQPRGSK